MKKKLIIIIPVLLLVFVTLFLTNSFALFSYAKEGLKVNFLTINGIDVELADPTSTALTLENSEPTFDNDGLNKTPFVFTLKNTSHNSLDYTIKVVNDVDRQNTCFLDAGRTQACPVLDTDYIRYAYKIGDGSYTTPQTLGTNNDIIISSTLSSLQNVQISLVMWIDINAGNDVQNNSFYGKLILQGQKSSN